MAGESPRSGVTHVDITLRAIALLVAAVVAVWLALRLWSVLVVVIVALVFAAAFDPAIVWLQRRGIRRGRALALVFVIVALAIVALVLLTVPPLVSQLRGMIADAPHTRERVLAWMAEHEWTAPFERAVNGIPVDDLLSRAGDALLGYSTRIAAAIGYAITTFVLSIYLLADPASSKTLLYAIVPRAYHAKLATIVVQLKTIVGGYMRGQLITSVAITMFTFALLTAFGVGDALAIAVFAGLTDIIPFVGGYIATTPAAIAVVPRGTVAVIVVLVLMFAYQEFESRVLIPRVYGRTLRMRPAAVMIALLVGGTLLGILGALLALPIAAGLQMVVRELRVAPPGEAPIGTSGDPDMF